jgi:hypothetical protein
MQIGGLTDIRIRDSISLSGKSSHQLAKDKDKMTFSEWKFKVMLILERSGESFSDYELKPCYRDGMTPKDAVRWLLGFDD